MNPPKAIVIAEEKPEYPKFLGIDAVDWSIIGIGMLMLIAVTLGIKSLMDHERRKQRLEDELVDRIKQKR